MTRKTLKQSHRLRHIPIFFSLLLLLIEIAHATEPPLARLSFWVPSERMAEFETVYEERLVPLLKEHGLKPSSIQGRPVANDIFSRLLEPIPPIPIGVATHTLWRDSLFAEVKKELGTRFGAAQPNGEIKSSLWSYRIPTSPFSDSPPVEKIQPKRMTWDRLQSVDGPTLARLTFWMPPERKEAFESAYEKQVAPLLADHGLVESTHRGRATIDSAFSHLFEFDDLASFQQQKEGLVDWLREGEPRFPRDKFAIDRITLGLYQNPLRVDRTAPAGRGTGHWRSYTAADGLAGVDVHSLFQDRSGYLWIGTDHGLSRFDGRDFQNFDQEEGLADAIVLGIFQDDDRLWFGAGNFWMRRTFGGLFRYDSDKKIPFTAEKELAGSNVLSVYVDMDGNTWIGTRDDGLNRFDGKSYRNITLQYGLPGHAVISILQDRDGDLWFGTRNGGVHRFDGETFENFSLEDGLADSNVISILQDRDGDLWFGTGVGASRFSGSPRAYARGTLNYIPHTSSPSAFTHGLTPVVPCLSLMAKPLKITLPKTGWPEVQLFRLPRIGTEISGSVPRRASLVSTGKSSPRSPEKMGWPTTTPERSSRIGKAIFGLGLAEA